MRKEDKIKTFEDNISRMYLNKDVVNDCTETLKHMWCEFKQDDDALALCASVTKRDDDSKAIELYSPLVSGLILLDYKNVDSLIYKILINIIYNSPIISKLVNPFLSEKSYTFLISTLYNENLVLTDKQKLFLLDEAFKYNIEIQRLLKILITNYGYFDNGLKLNVFYETIHNIYNTINERNKNLHWLSNPADIRYFIVNHKLFDGFDKDEKFKKYYESFFTITESLWKFYNTSLQNNEDYLFINDENEDMKNFSILLEDTVQRVNIRNLSRIPFL